jgi:hypothetical protein
MVHRVVLFLISLIMGALYILWLGKSVVITLGWASFLLPLIWIIMGLAIKAPSHYGKILLFVLTLTGFIILNHITHVTVARDLPLNIATMYLYLLPASLIYVPFSALMDSPVVKRSGLPGKNAKVFRNYRNLLSCSGIAVFVSLALMCLTTRLSLMPFFLFIPFTLSLLVLLHILRRIPAGKMQYLLESLERVEGAPHRFLVLIPVMFTALAFSPLFLEYFRGLWGYGLVYAASLTVIGLNLIAVYRHIFRPSTTADATPERFHIPVVSMRWVAGTIYVLLVIYIIVVSALGLNQAAQFLKIGGGP